MAEQIYDVIVIGGGAGGVPAAIRAAQLGGRVALVEDKHLGGLCMNKGCIPFGHMMAASRIIGSLSLGKEMGIGFSGISMDFSTLKKRQDQLIAFMRQGVQGVLSKNGITLFRARGKLAGMGKVEVNGEILLARKIILATGARWKEPDFPNNDLPEVVNSDYLLSTKQLPEKCLLYGNGPMIVEIAQFLHRFRSKVWLVTKEKTLLHGEPKTITSRLVKALKTQGIKILTGTKIMSLRNKKDGLHAVLKGKGKEESVVVDRVLSFKRKASLKGLGLHTVGLEEEDDFVRVNDRMETGMEGIYAIGDLAVPESMQYSHLASAGGIIAAENAMGMDNVFNPKTTARVTFSQPQVACVGLTPVEAKKEGYEIITGSAPLSINPYGMILSQNEGIVEVVAEKRYGEILGIHIIGEGACEMASLNVLAIQMEATLEDLSRAVFPHPTLSESFSEAARDCLGQAIYLP